VAVSLDVHCSGEGKKGKGGKVICAVRVSLSLSLSSWHRDVTGCRLAGKRCHSLSMVKYRNLTMIKSRTYPGSAV